VWRTHQRDPLGGANALSAVRVYCPSVQRRNHGRVEAPRKPKLFKHKNPEGKTLAEGLSGDDLHRKSGKWMKKERLINRAEDRYKEVITDPETGGVVHHCDEPLSQHRGHGSAKKKKKS
jgi:hypothetical protein